MMCNDSPCSWGWGQLHRREGDGQWQSVHYWQQTSEESYWSAWGENRLSQVDLGGHSLLTLVRMLTLAWARVKVAVTFVWPLLQAACNAVDPFCIQSKVKIKGNTNTSSQQLKTNWSQCTLNNDIRHTDSLHSPSLYYNYCSGKRV